MSQLGAKEHPSAARTRPSEVVDEIDHAIESIRRAREQGQRATKEPLRPSGLHIMVFPANRESHYRLHTELFAHLMSKNLLDGYEFWSLDLGGTEGLAGMLFVLGNADKIVNHATAIYYLPEAEAFVADRCGNDWDRINPAQSYDDVPAPGCSLDLGKAEDGFVSIAGIARSHKNKLTAIN